ncbi:hypothetical protein DPMN_036435 [Dreissena polymorpha]|uniref:Snake toxin/toxin-like domain-containing protein n=1 Tax=Dreissena polymorpha TaxID=45954 RepID=A0A9D4MDK6_DREPO|nr:hypothetical protein DPMN_036435 [Dreissena polymorpha]
MPIICSVCCTGSLCNSGGCGNSQFDNLTSGSRGPVCFDCYQQLTTDDCDKIRMCGRDEVCDLRTTSVGTTSDVLWKTSCVSRLMCPALSQSTINGHTRQSANLCCESDLCNNIAV